MDRAPQSCVFAGLLPHPPIIVPDVGRGRIADCQATHDACQELARRLVARQPDRLFLVSPHAPRLPGSFGLASGRRLRGSLIEFGARRAAVDLPPDEATARHLRGFANQVGVPVAPLTEADLDHGSVVPLWFLAQAGWDGPTTVAALPMDPNPAMLASFGSAVARALDAATGRFALIASGDMTHRARPGAPAGYHERAVEFDAALTDLVREGRLDEIAAIDSELRSLAAEDTADSAQVIAASLGGGHQGHEVLSYEHPFGVGYLVAVFHDGNPEAR